VSDAKLYSDNAAAMWASLAPWSREVPGTAPGLSVIDLPAQSATRVILRWPLTTDPGQIGDLVAAAGAGTRVVVEDSFGMLDLPAGDRAVVDRMPLMVRPAGGAAQPDPDGVWVVQAADAAMVVQAERVIVEGFPRPALQPFQPGRMLPAQVLRTPGWRTWLAYRGAEPAAACCSYDDGAAVGIYWLATLPQHRGAGLGRAVMCAALAASPHRPAALVATAAGEPLYTSLGFRPVAQAVWYRLPGHGS
jgi:GNAT superfamily N-acetyltransferase